MISGLGRLNKLSLVAPDPTTDKTWKSFLNFSALPILVSPNPPIKFLSELELSVYLETTDPLLPDLILSIDALGNTPFPKKERNDATL